MASQLFTKYTDVFNFGKYKDQTFSAVLKSNPDYINWGIKNNIIQLSHELENWMNQDSSATIANKPDSDIENLKSFVLDIISQKLLVDSITKTLENGIEITDDEMPNKPSVGINPLALKLFEMQKVSFREELLANILNKNKGDLNTKIHLLFELISGQKLVITEDRLTYIYEEVDEIGLLTIEIHFIKNNFNYNSLEILYHFSMLRDFYKFDVSIPFKLS